MIPGYPEQLYHELRCELQSIQDLHLTEEKEAEACFGACMLYEQKLAKWVSAFDFEKEEDEIYFFKILRPGFTSQIEYYKKLYQSILFKPSCKKEQSRFFEYEIDKADRFFIENAGFYQYYKNGQTSNNSVYFLRSCHQENSPGNPCRSETGYDLLLAAMQGLERYKDFAQRQIDQLRKI
jgi:hypothetical protein